MGKRIRKALRRISMVEVHGQPTMWRDPFKVTPREPRPRDRTLRGKARVKARKAESRRRR